MILVVRRFVGFVTHTHSHLKELILEYLYPRDAQRGGRKEEGIVNLGTELNSVLKEWHENKRHCSRLQRFPLPA